MMTCLMFCHSNSDHLSQVFTALRCPIAVVKYGCRKSVKGKISMIQESRIICVMLGATI
jgi:hypothetical protein